MNNYQLSIKNRLLQIVNWSLVTVHCQKGIASWAIMIIVILLLIIAWEFGQMGEQLTKYDKQSDADKIKNLTSQSSSECKSGDFNDCEDNGFIATWTPDGKP